MENGPSESERGFRPGFFGGPTLPGEGRQRAMILRVTEAWRTTYPEAHVGVLAIRDVSNPRRDVRLEGRKRDLEQHIRKRFAGQTRGDLAALPTMRAYRAFYKRFRKTYHVLPQLHSVALNNKPLPSVAALVEAMFMAEIKNGLLTAGHDRDQINEPIALDVAKGNERCVVLNQQEELLKAGDMMMTDLNGVICSVIHGLDLRTAITPQTRRVMYVVYAPSGITAAAVRQHLEEILDNVLLISPEAVVDELHVYNGATPAR